MTDPHHLVLLLIGGGLVLLVSWLPLVLKSVPLSVPIVCVALGYAASFVPLLHVRLDAAATLDAAEKIGEAVMLLALMGAGLRIDRPFSWAAWGTPWRLLLVAMPITMVLVFASAHWGLGLGAAASLLLAAALAPTDPVLAGDVQTGPPGAGEDGETRFGLTAEAGFNDGLAFPFVVLAMALKTGTVGWVHWAGATFAAEIAIGVVIGLLLGRLMGWLMFRLPSLKLSDTGDGLVAIGATFVCYAATVLLHGNGFIAVFVTALTIRHASPHDEFHETMADSASQIERILVMLVLVLFGWALGQGILSELTWQAGALAVAILLVFRPISTGLAFLGSTAPKNSKRLIAIFGIRGIGTIYYLLFATHSGLFPEHERLWSVAAAAILVSIVVHGMLSTPLMDHADRLRRKHGHKSDHAEFETSAPARSG
ncbi:cation:proton antiporter [Sphingomonas nostoxanthinifaciens]|uniref:cation:proton antiporter n=1 Tax=Sphingomonas nostoxanthinifaciens TaxID=2872652 RepID=UPI001CC1D7C8|nr:cation:proton antiporter [Sphingomonas nostoxanthinifaciens]UAK25718.1 cation:proton antiporter [Sphingomonas nostoxanthinifaciens]